MNGDCESIKTDILVDLSQPVSPKPVQRLSFQDDDDDFLTTIPINCSDQVLIGVNDVSYSVDHQRRQTKRECKKSNSDSECSPQLLDEELFDFDLPTWEVTSFTESDHDEGDTKTENKGVVDEDEEVFFGPVGHTEKCVAVSVSEVAQIHETTRSLSPLTASEMAELCREACTVASRIKIAAGSDSCAAGKKNYSSNNQIVDCESELSSGQLDGLIQCIGNTLPAADSNGVVKFSAAMNQSLPKLAKQSVGSSKASQLRSGLSRPTTRKTSLDHAFLSNIGVVSKSEGDSCKNEKTAKEAGVRSPRKTSLSMKRQCVLSAAQCDAADFSDTASIASDTSEASHFNAATGKRVLPQPKFVRSAMSSKVPVTTGNHVSDDSNRSQSSTSSAGSDAATVAQRSDSVKLKEPSSTRLPAFGVQQSRLSRPTVYSSANENSSPANVSSTATSTEKISGLRPPGKPASGFAVPGSDKRKTLTAIRNLNLVGAGPKQGPLKAVQPGVNSVGNGHSSSTGLKLASRGGAHMPNATSTPCKPIRPDARLNSSLCTPSRSSCRNPPSTTGSTQKRLSCVPTPGRLNSSFGISRGDVSITSRANPKENESSVQRRNSNDVARLTSSVAKTPLSKENASVMSRHCVSSAFQPKDDDQRIGNLATRKLALKSSNN